MGLELYWDDDAQTVFLCEVEGAWTWDELYTLLDNVITVCARRDLQLAAIIHFRGRMQPPGGAMFNTSALEHAHRLGRLGADGTGMIVVVGIPAFLKGIFNTFVKLYPKALGSVRFAGTLDEARAMLAREREPTA